LSSSRVHVPKNWAEAGVAARRNPATSTAGAKRVQTKLRAITIPLPSPFFALFIADRGEALKPSATASGDTRLSLAQPFD